MSEWMVLLLLFLMHGPIYYTVSFTVTRIRLIKSYKHTNSFSIVYGMQDAHRSNVCTKRHEAKTRKSKYRSTFVYVALYANTLWLWHLRGVTSLLSATVIDHLTWWKAQDKWPAQSASADSSDSFYAAVAAASAFNVYIARNTSLREREGDLSSYGVGTMEIWNV